MKLRGSHKAVVCGAVWVSLLICGTVSSQDFALDFVNGPAGLPAPDRDFDGEPDGPPWPEGADAYGGAPGTEVSGAYFCTLQDLTNGLGAQGWQLSWTADGGSIADVTVTEGDIGDPAGSGGFDNTELTSGAGNEGALSALVLHLKKGTTLPDVTGENPAKVARFLMKAVIPEGGGTVTLRYIDGLRGSGQPVDNKVTTDGQSTVPATSSKEIMVGDGGQGESCVGERNNIAFSASVIDSADEFAEGILGAEGADGNLAIETPQGTTPRATLYTNLVVNVPTVEQQPQGWQLSIALDGECSLAMVTVGGTAIYEEDTGPNFSGGFDNTEVINPAKNADQKGVVSAVVLHLKKGTLLDVFTDNEPGTASVLRMELERTVAQGDSTTTCRVSTKDGLVGSGQPVDNKVTIDGNSEVPCNAATASSVISFAPTGGASDPTFVRGNANNDGRIDLGDPIWILNELFTGGPATTCQDAADANDDDAVNITDAEYLIMYLFQAGPVPPAPFDSCGGDTTSPETLSCATAGVCF